ncbi:uncharacterized protein LOC102081299 [Oreochromis niloticus]|uniref:uncharacterized protein LOC102081299 n=1 Tax=Oreochromis niloticus TaxID=8128 RepID=UPI0009053E16|nr:uncharacterized protein LOC102081299 [Oreochromis niloticus]XP_039472748.1 uncharacterized protein LOC120441522 [Oreochromis aureus]CAI5658451.1 unnamed protein product [Mustela putorius furo]
MANRSRTESYVWTDHEVELFLNLTLEYKTAKTQENVDWETCQGKYADIHALFLEQYPSEKSQEFPHRKEDITRAIITTKMKAIRGKYRQAVDSGRKSGHGRVVLLYFELCEQIWGGSPATTAIPSGIETADVDTASHRSESASTSSAPDISTVELSDVSDQAQSGDSDLPTSVVKERRDLLNAKLKGHRQDRLKRRLSTETQLLNVAEVDIQMKKRILDMMETSERRASEHYSTLSVTLERLTSSIADGFSLLRQAMHPPPPLPFNMPPYHGGHIYPCAPSPHTVSGTFPPNTTINEQPSTATSSPLPLQGTGEFSFTRALMEDDI